LSRLRSASLCLPALLAGCHAECSRPSDDRLEPNNDRAHASRLERNAQVTARSVEGDVDAWSFEARRGDRLEIKVVPHKHFGEIVLYGPAGAELARGRGRGIWTATGWQHDLDVSEPGMYVVTVLQDSAADNVFWFSWDYTISVSDRR
jgi:hypothetical protein